MSAKLFILEIQQYVPQEGFSHVGYLNKFFKTKAAAAKHYNDRHAAMRELNAYGTWCSDCHPDTRLRYVVRPYNCEACSLTPSPATAAAPPTPTAALSDKATDVAAPKK